MILMVEQYRRYNSYDQEQKIIRVSNLSCVAEVVWFHIENNGLGC